MGIWLDGCVSEMFLSSTYGCICTNIRRITGFSLIVIFAPWLYLHIYYVKMIFTLCSFGDFVFLEECLILRSMWVSIIMIPVSLFNLFVFVMALILLPNNTWLWCLLGAFIGGAEVVFFEYVYRVPFDNYFMMVFAGLATGAVVAFLLRKTGLRVE